jgi:predicted nucleic acid-binding protein
MDRLRVFADTGVLVAMLVFPRDQQGQPTLAGEVLHCYDVGEFDLLLSRAVMDELEEVIERDFSDYYGHLVTLFAPFEERLTRWPTPQEIRDVLPIVVDADDAPIFAAALIAQPDIVLSNDFETFHTSQAKAFWQAHQIQVESLYGLLCVLGRRERK